MIANWKGGHTNAVGERLWRLAEEAIALVKQ